ncbi:1-acyl-sn-glycerol-3-phosphate acyltransferase [Roseateles saccharophilus]|uniref:1-acyl-sn-glycerol-3-phosphate acyltransferase n=1 Tax=Roseateles saccharophilus TaxID=304 RepID=A0A4R3UGP5_ROSSA|nr:1-acyl-sn-glycerol-3-phosphate acyltransferase [Roseateles saccharophilus]TCU90685.1 1-acyl-sn-glycerol-3-phosphate acyltransferase [Roseateles saccharophilus]
MTATPAVLTGPLHPHGGQSRLARGVLGLFGWTVDAPGLPTEQGVILVYPHTSNWDFVVGVLAKWALGLQLRFWGKDSLFRVPLLGRWVRWIGGVAVDRGSPHGIVADTVAQMRSAAARGERFWLAVAPEGTRSLTAGWRTGAYQVAVQAGVPVGLCYFDFQRRVVSLNRFIMLTGDVQADFAAFADYLGPRVGKRPALASPIQPKPPRP